MKKRLTLMIMSGVSDGATFELRTGSDGKVDGGYWTLSIGRSPKNDICLRNDNYISRYHGFIHLRYDRWELEDKRSTNGTFIEDEDDMFNDERVEGTVPIEVGQLFRVGKTWLRLHEVNSYGTDTD